MERSNTPAPNLLGQQSNARALQRHNTGNGYLIVAVLVAIIVGAVYAVVFFYHDNVQESLQVTNKQIDAIEDKRNAEVENDIHALDKQLKTVNALLSQHVIWSDEVEHFTTLIHPRVQLNDVQFNYEEGTYNFGAIGDSYAVVAQQIASFYSDGSVRDVDISGVKEDNQGNVSFTMTVTFDTKKLLLSQ